MKTKLMIVMAIAMMSLVVGAVTIGQIITQQQIDNYNFDGERLNARYEKDGSGNYAYSCSGRVCELTLKYVSLEKEMEMVNTTEWPMPESEEEQWTGDYIVIEKSKIVRFDKKWAKDATTQERNKFLKRKASEFINAEIRKLELLKTQDGSPIAGWNELNLDGEI